MGPLRDYSSIDLSHHGQHGLSHPNTEHCTLNWYFEICSLHCTKGIDQIYHILRMLLDSYNKLKVIEM